ncbi:MAG: hypothetical protein K8S14_07735 [Actinomycetia bacterium]|nr:hypothetical protein [Actinomycetes bacterium]
MEHRGRKESIITLIIMIIVATVIVSWITGLWSCEAGRKDLTKEQRLTISDYINSVSVLVQQSNKVSYTFFNTINKVKDISREELDKELLDIIEESRVILQNSNELNPPEGFEVSHGYLELVFDTRNRSYEDFRPALFNALDDLDIEISTTQITNTFLYMFMSDEIYVFFQDKLKESGENIGIGNLIIIDSAVLQDRSLTDAQSVVGFISDIKTVAKLQERRGVAVIGNSIEFNPPVVNENGEYWILGNGKEISIAVKIENQGNVVENDVVVLVSYKTENNISDEKSYTIGAIDPSEQKVVTLSGFTAYPGRKCEIEVTAGPVPGEVFMGNNTLKIKFMMEN